MTGRAIYPIFLLSGLAGLIYEVVWVRWFGRVFGNSVYSAALVISVFMFGLGVGSYLAGRWIDRRAARGPGFSLRAYGWTELAVGLLGAGLAWLLPSIEPLAAHLSFYAIGDHGWHELSRWSLVLQLVTASALLAPITLLMGATLTLLIRFVVADEIARAGWRIGLLYGFNTAGAAFGAAASDLLLVPHFGLFATQMLAVVANLGAALAALRLAAALAPAPAPTAPAPAEPRSPALDEPAGARTGPLDSTVAFTALAIFLSGFCAMGIEIYWFRYLGITLGGLRVVFSLLLTVILVGIWLGSLAGGYCQRRWGRPAMLYMLSQTGFVVATLVLLAVVEPRRGAAVVAGDPFGESLRYHLLVVWGVVKPIVAVVGLPALLMGFAYPLANANIQHAESHVGRRAGVLYLANTAGAVAGSLIAGFALLPWLGTRLGAVVLAGVGAAAALVLHFADPDRRNPGRRRRLRARMVAAGCAIAIAAGLLVWLRVPSERFLRLGIRRYEKVLAIREGVNELVAVTEIKGTDVRILKTNGHNMSGTAILGQRYMRAFSHIPLLQLASPRDVLVICFGVGETIHAASLHPTVERIELVDLSRDVVEQAHYFAASNHDVLEDPRVHVYINDGRLHLWMRPEGSYDLITLEPPPLAFAGVSALYTREFYQLARSRLREGGFMTQWLPAYQLPGPAVLALVRAFVDVFPNAVLLSGDRRELILMGARAPRFTIDPAAVAARLARAPAVRADLERIYMGTLTELIGTFVSDADNLRRAVRDVAPVTDDFPIMEYAAAASDCGKTRLPEQLIDLSRVTSWCPTCVVDGRPAPQVAELDDYLLVLDHYYRGKGFLVFDSCARRREQLALPLPPDAPVFRHTTYLRRILAAKDASGAGATDGQ